MVDLRQYRIKGSYKDLQNRSAEDQFMRWLNIEGSGMPNSGGIRPLRFVSSPPPVSLHGVIVLMTNQKHSNPHNPWNDNVDWHSGRITYWGDAKYHEQKGPEDFNGNKALLSVRDACLEKRWNEIPPILHFTKENHGFVTFNGLCVLDKLELTWFEDKGKPVRNYRADLRILNEDQIAASWLVDRRRAKTLEAGDENAPASWKSYRRSGKADYLRVWASKVRSKDEQLPDEGSTEDKILSQLCQLDAFDFEKVVVAIFKDFKDIDHRIERTRNVADGGFDFYGSFELQKHLSYEVRFRGEVKKYARNNSVNPKEVSRLVARLRRGEYAIFVTTSFFTKQAQYEVYENEYPVALISGEQLVKVCYDLQIVSDDRISLEWLESVLKDSKDDVI